MFLATSAQPTMPRRPRTVSVADETAVTPEQEHLGRKQDEPDHDEPDPLVVVGLSARAQAEKAPSAEPRLPAPLRRIPQVQREQIWQFPRDPAVRFRPATAAHRHQGRGQRSAGDEQEQHGRHDTRRCQASEDQTHAEDAGEQRLYAPGRISVRRRCPRP